MFDLIKRLSELPAPSGQEEAVLEVVEDLWRTSGLQTERSKIGNLIGRLGGSGPEVIVVAHADELTYLVRAIDPNGFLWLANGQAWSRTLHIRDWFTVGSAVTVLAPTGPMPGIVAAVTGHAATLRLPEPAELTWDDLWVDTGMTRDELSRRGVTPGTRIVWAAECRRLGSRIVGKALDDRGGVAVLCKLATTLRTTDLRCSLKFVCTVQEEIGVVGAAALARSEDCDAAIIVESGLAGDVPHLGDNALPIQLGNGPTIIHKDSMVHYDRRLTKRLTVAADQAHLSIQHAVIGSFGTDGSAFMRADTPTALITFPTRYTHTPFEMADLDDITSIATLLHVIVTTPWAEMV